MAGVDAELLERVARWCAEAGRQAGRAEIRRALEPLAWDELLAVRALLADPPPARPLGPQALADIARGAPPDLAAERERDGRYRSEATEGGEERGGEVAVPPAPPPPPPAPRQRSAAPRRGPGVVIRRAREAAPPPSPPTPRLPELDELLRPEGRAVLERLVRRHGGRRAALTAALAEGWRLPGGATPGDAELARLLEHHGLARGFERRERDELLHALRAAGGVRDAAAARVGLDAPALDAALARLGAAAEAEKIREARRADLRARATLAERVRLLLGDEARLRDLGLLAEIEADLRGRLPEHVRALRRGAGPVAPALARSLSLTPADARALAARFALDVGAPSSPRAQRRETVAPRRAPAGRAAGRRPRSPPRAPGAGAPGGKRRAR